MPDNGLMGRTAVVTGASRGIGLAIARRLAEDGATVLMVSRKPSLLDVAVQKIQEEKGKAYGLPIDVTDVNAPLKILEWIHGHGHRIDALINNAGAALTKPMLEVTDDEWATLFNVNVHAVFRLCRAVGSLMCQQRAGKIVNVASVYGLVGAASVVPYAASKGALIQLTRGLAVEWARHNIQVNAVAPGYVGTDMNTEALKNPRFYRQVMSRTPAHRLGVPADVGEAVRFLVDPRNDYITGHVLAVDGGWLAN